MSRPAKPAALPPRRRLYLPTPHRCRARRAADAAGPGKALPKLIHQAAGGDGTAAATAMLHTLSPPGLTGYGLTYGVLCREHPAFSDAASMLADAKKAQPDFPDSVLALPPRIPRVLGECPGRPGPRGGRIRGFSPRNRRA